ncbi:T7SS effector LXG polymorphic toxin [Virgibacillus halodenitrificans]|uniref:T7SS effector LXG polymorphic toxin n=1 Tax=Virgibacillus halodenitrificans TaxID=1482 RepID=UPI002DC0227D|nr:T7SS effector LXG polymorphic toxin [Virgibacillus halodenitrificans]MEC2159698.1 T7SS effector LXG polymorphic toxin [Virgibacillus halodenitrificans]
MEQLHNGLDQTVKEVNDLGPHVKELEQRMQTLINLEDSFQGKGAQAIKSFYEKAHMPFLLLMEGMLTDFAKTIGQIKSSVQAFESNEKGVIHEHFLQENVEQGLTTAENVTLSLTDEANALIDEVKDIVVLPEIQEEDFRQRIKQSRNQVDHTLENLYALDEESTGKLEKMDNDLQMMKTYVEKISGLFQNGDLRVADYEVKQLSTSDFHQELVGAVKEKAKHNTFSLDVFLEWGGKKVLSRFGSLGDVAIAYIQEKFSMRTIDYSVRTMKAVLAATGSHITAAEFATVKDQVVKEVAVSDYKSEWQGTYLTLANGRILRKYTDTAGEVQYQFVEEIPESREQNAFMKTADAFGEIGQDVWDAAGQRADKMTDSWYDFGNYITFGAVEGMYEGYMHRADKMFDSTYDLFNAFSFGTADMIQGAINPEENFSKEHWLNSIGLAGMMVGARVPAGRAGSGSKTTVNKVEGAKKTPDATPKAKPDAGKMTIPTIQTLTGKLNWFKAHLPEMRVVQDSTGGQHYVFSKRGDGGTKAIDNTKNRYVSNPYKRNGNLKSNVKYKSGEYNYSYETDNLGRIIKFETDNLQLTTRENRLSHNPNTPGKQQGDHAGHLAGDRFGGSPELDNLVSQSSNINLSQYKKLENLWANAIKDGKQVNVNVKVEYSGNSSRPLSFNVQYEIDGERFIKDLLN